MTFLAYIKQKLLLNAILYKKGAMTLSSISLATIISFFSLEFKIEDQYFGITTSMILLLSLLIFIDSVTGIIASRHDGNKVESGKLLFIFYKFLLSFLFFWIANEITKSILGRISTSKSNYLITFYSGANEIVEIVTYAILILLMLREWISIGENVERRFNKRYYLFDIIEKIFDLIERKLLGWLENTDMCKPKEPTENNNQNLE